MSTIHRYEFRIVFTSYSVVCVCACARVRAFVRVCVKERVGGGGQLLSTDGLAPNAGGVENKQDSVYVLATQLSHLFCKFVFIDR